MHMLFTIHSAKTHADRNALEALSRKFNRIQMEEKRYMYCEILSHFNILH